MEEQKKYDEIMLRKQKYSKKKNKKEKKETRVLKGKVEKTGGGKYWCL